MAVDVEALKALGLSDQEIAQIAGIDAGNFQPITAEPQPVTNPIAGAYDYTPLYGGGDIIPGLTSGIFERLGLENPNVPVFRLLGSENKGGDNVNESMNFAAVPGQSYRLVNNATGEVLGEASTPEAISALVDQSNALSKQLGKKADLSFETSTPEVFGGGYSPIFEDQPNVLFDTPMKLLAAGMLASIGGGLLQPGGLGGAGGAGAAGGTGATSAAGVTGATTAASAAPAVASAAPAVFEAAPIIVTGTGATSAAIPAAITAAAATPSLLSSAANAPAQPPASTAPPATAFPEELIVTAKDAAPVTFGNVAPVLLPSVGAALGSSIASTATPDLTQTPEKKSFLDRIASGMGVTDYLTVASLLGSAVAGGGGGGGAPAMPYVSPFGTGTGLGLGTGRDMRVNPNIADYERYGFGPEASFFAPGYSQLVSGAAGAPAATTMGPQGAMVNPQYVPLI